MWKFPVPYDVIVMGGGHAGCEAALAAARMGVRTLLITMNLDTIGKMSCNPAVGGIGKGHMVREIDALGGEMGKVIDLTGIQYRMLNRTKGPAVWAPRAQADKVAYQFEMKHRLELQESLDIVQGTVEEIFTENGRVSAILTKEGIHYTCKSLILSSGTFMRGLLHIGENQFAGGRAGDQPAVGLSVTLKNLGFELGRLKTGTPPRIHKASIDYSQAEEQPGESDVKFSYDPSYKPRLPQVSCHIVYTTKETQEIVEKNLHRSPLFSGVIEGIGPRYCPSFEDKVVRFPDKDRHQIFLEPEGIQTEEVYANGISSSLPLDVQFAFIHSIPALRNARVMRPAYAIEYDYVTSGQMHPTLESKKVEGLYFAGQINGTTGYEEAAGQGLLAAINAAAKLKGLPPFILNRAEAYLGVMIDDLCTKGLDEPYRMFTSRAEHRLLLRQDNADLRLRKYGYQYGLISEAEFVRSEKKRLLIDEEQKRLAAKFIQLNGKGYSFAQLLARPETNYTQLVHDYPSIVTDHGEEINFQIEINQKYGGYIERQKGEIEKLSHLENIKIPSGLDYMQIKGLPKEAQQKLSLKSPINLGQASRISGVSSADITVLMVFLARYNKSSAA